MQRKALTVGQGNNSEGEDQMQSPAMRAASRDLVNKKTAALRKMIPKEVRIML
jgi:hypothetical protein